MKWRKNKSEAARIAQVQTLYMEIGDRIRRRRKILGLNQQDLADAVSLSRSTIANIETGRQRILLESLFDIAAKLKMPITAFLRIALMACLPLIAADNVVDVGVLKPSRPIRIGGAGRPDFSHFTIKVFAHGWQTNDVTVTTTNGFVTTEDLKAVPQGPATMEVRVVCDDGAMSEPVLFRFDMRRFVSAPRAMPSGPMPTLPSFPGSDVATASALPGGTNKVYLHRSGMPPLEVK